MGSPRGRFCPRGLLRYSGIGWVLTPWQIGVWPELGSQFFDLVLRDFEDVLPDLVRVEHGKVILEDSDELSKLLVVFVGGFREFDSTFTARVGMKGASYGGTPGFAAGFECLI